jgi:predicted TIM-barrel fold metal-dependent hydrolase
VLDVNAFLGPYPFRHVPHPDADALLRVLEREGIREAWVGHLPSAFHRDPSAGNAWLHAQCAASDGRLRFVPTIRPDWPGWEQQLDHWTKLGAVAVRAYPPQWQMGPHEPAMVELAVLCGELRLPLVLTVRFEDLRQRSALDTAGDLSAAAVRSIARAGFPCRLIVTGAGRNLIEETHWGLTPDEQQRVYWDFSWVWGPPEDHLAKLFRTVGAGRFVYGTQWPLRLAQNPRANLDLLPDDLRHARLADPQRLFD